MTSLNEHSEFFSSCAETYRFLSQLYFKELNVEAINALSSSEWPRDTGNANLDEGYAKIKRYFAFGVPDRRQQLAVEYARIFLAAGVYTKEVKTAIPYESVFTTEEHIMMGPSRDDVVATFREDGFAVDPSLHEPEDHLSFLLEYLQMMCMRAVDLCTADDPVSLIANMRRQCSFMNEHLLNWLPLLSDVVQDYATVGFYPGMMLVTAGSLEQARDYMEDSIRELEGR
jgi:TorA maturation chaperone TorD